MKRSNFYKVAFVLFLLFVLLIVWGAFTEESPNMIGWFIDIMSFASLGGGVAVFWAGVVDERWQNKALVLLNNMNRVMSSVGDLSAPVNESCLVRIHQDILQFFDIRQVAGSYFILRLPPMLAEGSLVKNLSLESYISGDFDVSWNRKKSKDNLISFMGENKDVYTLTENNEYSVLYCSLKDYNATSGLLIVLRKDWSHQKQLAKLLETLLTNSINSLLQHLGALSSLKKEIHVQENEQGTMVLLRNLTHELGGELQTMRGAWSRLKMELLLDIDLGENHGAYGAQERIDVSTIHSGNIVDMLRDLPKYKNGWFLIDEIKDIYVVDVLTPVIDAVRVSWPDIKLNIDRDIGRFVVKADESLKIVFRNLLFNAASFSPPNGTVHISVHKENSFAVITVQDEGDGVSPENAEMLFKYSSTVSSKDQRRIDVAVKHGMGVGLTISNAIARGYQGWIEVVNNTVVKGGCFNVYLPLATDPDNIKLGENDYNLIICQCFDNPTLSKDMSEWVDMEVADILEKIIVTNPKDVIKTIIQEKSSQVIFYCNNIDQETQLLINRVKVEFANRVKILVFTTDSRIVNVPGVDVYVDILSIEDLKDAVLDNVLLDVDISNF